MFKILSNLACLTDQMLVAKAKSLSWISLVLAGLCVSGCTPTNATATLTATGTEEVGALPTSSPTLKVSQDETPVVPSPTIVPSLSPSAFPVTPEFLNLAIADHPVFSTTEIHNCALPCWHGLRPGESNITQAQEVFENVFGFDGIYLVDLLGKSAPSIPVVDSDLLFTRFLWEVPPNEPTPAEGEVGHFSIEVAFDEVKILQGIRMSELPRGAYPIDSLKEIISRLGSPDSMLLYPQTNLSYGTLHIYLIYIKGVSFFIKYDENAIIENNNRTYGPVCFSEMPTSNVVYLTAPLIELNGTNATPLQESWILQQAAEDNWKTSTEILGMSLEEVTNFMLEPNPCIEVDFPAN